MNQAPGQADVPATPKGHWSPLAPQTESIAAEARPAPTIDLYPFPLDRMLIAAAVLPVVIALGALAANALDPMFFTGLVGATIASLLLLALRAEVREAFSSVWQRNLLYTRGTREPAHAEAFAAYLERLRRSLGGWGWAVIAVGFMAYAVPQFIVAQRIDVWGALRARGIGAVSLLFSDWPVEHVVAVAATGVLGFVLGHFAWRMLCVGRFVYGLGGAFDARIQTQHPDGAGGWGQVGAVCFVNALVLTVPAIHLGVWRALIATVPSVRLRYSNYEEWFGYGLLITFLLAILAFVAPLYGVHRAMQRERDLRQRELDAISSRMDALASEMRSAAEQANTARLDDLKKRHTLLRELYETERAIPTWPVDLRVVGKYVVAQLLPLLSLTKVTDFVTARLFGDS
jgi:hypothetical protein